MDEIPLAMYLVIMGFTLVLVVFTLIYRINIVRIITGFISMLLAYTNSMLITSGNVVLYYATVEDGGKTIPVTNITYSYFWLFIAIMMLGLTIIFILDMINENFQSAVEEKKMKEEYEYGIW